ncbi:MAG: hypothetical protein A2075_09790 [Geobacteraceae bacterium GWC2_58_44]|nr:MAG: hypothetical protein A2075_09790 [Geobacteraceae bacterium GWC2_58_44]HBG06993.1 hypothetical protein [Geobacter sp.]
MVEATEKMPRSPRRKLRPLLWVLGILAAIAVILYIASYFIDEPLRRITEQKVNRSLKGYTVRIEKLRLQLIGFSLTLRGVTVMQQAHPDPPVAHFPYIKASVHWREILSGKLVGEFEVDRPKLHINLKQLRSEAASEVKLKERGWQQAVEAIYPLKINLVKINDAGITYIDQDPKQPLVLSHLNLEADNIRNIHLPDKVYPSSFHVDTRIFGAGYGVIDGKANFLAEPIPGIKAAIKLQKIPMDHFKPVTARYNVAIKGGVMRAEGNVEYAPKVQIAHLEDLTIQGLKADYIHMAKTAAVEKKRAKAVGKTAKELSNKPDVLITVDKINLTGSNLGMINDAAGTKYRVFLSDADFQLSNFSNQFSRGPAKARLQGMFMGSGVTKVTGEFRPEKKGPDLDLYVKIDNTQLKSMNDLLRAYGKFDVSAGTFSLVTELHVKDRMVTGYIKPFFKDMQVYDRREDKDKGIFRKMYEMLVGGVAKLLENRPRDQVATRADISGPLEQPETSTWQIVIQLVRNAFFRAILPTFEKEVSGAGRR